jgi:thymidylate synthase
MNKLDKQYTDLLQTILDYGVEKKDRTGTGTKSIFGYTIRHNMKDGFPLITTKKMFWKGIVTELIWFLRGDTNIKFLVDNNCHIWDGDAYQSYCKRYWELGEIAKIEYGSSYYNHETNEYEFETYSKEEFVDYIKTNDAFAKKWGELGPIYGRQWRNWNAIFDGGVDQIQNLIQDLKTNPDSRRLLVNAWNVGELDSMVLPPCHYGFQVYTRELSLDERNDLLYKKIGGDHKRENCFSDEEFERETLQDCKAFNIPTRAISLMWNQRSVDTGLGLPFNIASYGLLLEIIAKAVNMVPDQLIGNLGDTHLYSNHIEQAKEQIGRELRVDERVCMSYENPNLDLSKLQEGMSDEEFTKVCDEFKIPRRTRTPFELPTLNINTEFWPYEGGECGIGPIDAMSVIKSFSDDNFCRCLLEEDIQLGNYQSHPTIKAPLSN